MSENIFNKDEYVVYGTNGICKIEDIREISFDAGKTSSIYYVLRPERDKSSNIYVDIKSEVLTAKMRKILSKAQIDALLTSSADKDITWIDDRRERGRLFESIIAHLSREELILMVKCIYLKKQEMAARGKKISVTDEKYLKSAEKMINEEFSYALGIEPEEVAFYIANKLGRQEKI